MEQVWERRERGSFDRTVDTHIKTLRASCEINLNMLYCTHRGAGYSLGG